MGKIVDESHKAVCRGEIAPEDESENIQEKVREYLVTVNLERVGLK